MITLLLLVAAFCILGWGFYRSRSFGRLGLLSWFQSLVVALPWMLFFGLSFVGVELNLAAILLLLVGSTGTYIWLGRQMKAIAKTQEESDRANVSPQGSDSNVSSDALSTDSIESPPTGMTSVSNDSQSSGASGASRTSRDNLKTLAELNTDLPTASLGSPSAKTLDPMPEEDVQLVKTIFSIDTFFSTEQTAYYNGIICKGNLRGEAEAVHGRLSQRLSDLMGTKYRLFMMDDPSVNPPKPIVVVLPRTNDPAISTRIQWLMALILFLATSFTCMVAASIFQGFSLLQEWSRWPETMPLTLGVVMVLVVHELGHWITARQYDVRLGPPFLLPTWQIGSFGSLTRIESVMPNRTALFDIGFSGPAVSGVLSFVFLWVGLILSHEGSVFQLSPTFFHSSILVGTLARLMLGNQLQNTLVDINPLVIVGWLGLLITAINVMPVGQLDGGRIVQAIYGRKILRRTSIVTLVVLAIATFFNPLALYWMVVILLLQRQLEQPQLNELTEPDDTRAVLGLVALFLMVTMLLPLSPELATRIGIGG